MTGWKTIYRDGPHYFERGRSLCGYFTMRKGFQAEQEPHPEDACAKCWKLSHPISRCSRRPMEMNEMATFSLKPERERAPTEVRRAERTAELR
jgi:hypothetical protein